MRTTLAIDDDLLAKAKVYTGLTETSAIMREALKTFVEREAARRLALLFGTQPDLEDIPRRQSEP
jgi:Arc/MetJ family transcription regulator